MQDAKKLLISPITMDTRYYYPQETGRYALYREIADKYAFIGGDLVKNWFDREYSIFGATPDSHYGNPRHAHGIIDERNIPILAGVLNEDKDIVPRMVKVAEFIAEDILQDDKDRPDGGIGNPLFSAHFLIVCAFLAEGESREMLLKAAQRTGSRTILPAVWAGNLFSVLHLKPRIKLPKGEQSKKITQRLSKSSWNKTKPRKLYAKVCLRNWWKGKPTGFNRFKELLTDEDRNNLPPSEQWADKAHSEHLERLATCGSSALWNFIKSHVKLFFRIKETNVRIALVAHHVFLAFLFYHPTAYLLELLFWAKAYDPKVKKSERENESQKAVHQRWINSATLHKELHKKRISWNKIRQIDEVDILCDQTFPERVKIENYKTLRRLFIESPHYNDPERIYRINHFLGNK